MDLQNSGWAWIALALVNAGLAEQKGRSRWNWFFVSLFLGPLATACIVIWPRPEQTQTTAAVPVPQWMYWETAALFVAVAVVLAIFAFDQPPFWPLVAAPLACAAIVIGFGWRSRAQDRGPGSGPGREAS